RNAPNRSDPTANRTGPAGPGGASPEPGAPRRGGAHPRRGRVRWIGRIRPAPARGERPSMTRPRLVLATVALLTLGAAAGADAAEFGPVLLAQQLGVHRGTGLYINLFKFIPVLAIYLLWAKTCYWADDDMKELNNNRFELWNCVLFFSGVLGLVLLWSIPF